MKASLFYQLLENEKFGVCTKDAQGRVVEQNEECKRHCGDMGGQVCSKGCMEYLPKMPQWQGEADQIRALQHRPMYEGSFDIVFIRTKEHLTTIIHPIHEKIAESLSSLEGFGLTARELEVAQLIVQGFSNEEISKKLFISRSTLKTHINSIYKKLGDKSSIVSGHR
jgi:ATP/maltotriose-dependent transcriptional regulator MalT